MLVQNRISNAKASEWFGREQFEIRDFLTFSIWQVIPNHLGEERREGERNKNNLLTNNFSSVDLRGMSLLAFRTDCKGYVYIQCEIFG